MPAEQWTIDRTAEKFRYAHLHLRELRGRKSNDDWEHAHEEACMYQLVGAIEGTFQEMNTAHALGLSVAGATLNNLETKAPTSVPPKATLDVYLLERYPPAGNKKDPPAGWLSLLYALRNWGAHRRYTGRVLNVGSPSGDFNSFADPRTIPPTPLPGTTTDVLAEFERDARALIARAGRSPADNSNDPEGRGARKLANREPADEMRGRRARRTATISLRRAAPRSLRMRADPAWKSALLHKGQDVADLLEAVLSGKAPDLASLPVPFGPGQDPELRLRNFLEQIDRAIKAFDTDDYGRCHLCGVDLDRLALQQQPWLATCLVHAGRWIS